MRTSKRKGFTLIEFLIALVVIGFIVSLLIHYFSNPLQEASASSTATSIVQDGTAMVNACNAYLSKKGKYPTQLRDLATEGLLTKDLSSRDFSKTPLEGTGWDSEIRDIDLGDGSNKKSMLMLSMVHNDAAAAVCRKINQEVMQASAGAAIPTASDGELVWSARPPETVGKNSFCVEVTTSGGFQFYDFYLSL